MSYNKKCRWFSMEYVGNPGAVPACNQNGTLEVFDCASCQENPDNKKQTNADRIRAMTDEELVKHFTQDCNLGRVFYCPSAKEDIDRCKGNWNCEACFADWLKKEADND